jgi:hydrogenase maturation protein HypF
MAGQSTIELGSRAGALRIAVKGIVQGVGFRPTVYRLAHEHHVSGWIRNTSWGVEIQAEGRDGELDAFCQALSDQAPPLAQVESVDSAPAVAEGHTQFLILQSKAQQGAYQLVSPDVATCPDCLRELLDPSDRRYRYPFTNCTNCGPRFTIIGDVPYDRPRTTMAPFAMCPACQGEYDDPLDRRFHAQPNACPVCGPQLMLLAPNGERIADRDEALVTAAQHLMRGEIVALKGLGGMQLACDATDPRAIARLRERKRRPSKPLAIMCRDLDSARAEVDLRPEEVELLTSMAAPIVLAERARTSSVADNLAPDTRLLGIMLPYTPLHHLLLREVSVPLVMTSGNLSEEPLARDNDEALERLGGIADWFLLHDRGIQSRCDDSVWFVSAHGVAQPVRRARGYAPTPIKLALDTTPTLGCGAELKNTICLTREEYAFLSQHIGDMENLETQRYFHEVIELFQSLFHVSPEVVACDMHPDYAASRYARELEGVTRVEVQHHHAHLASCLADAGVDGPALGVILDGTGYGLDEHIWGGEFLLGDRHGFVRVAHLEYLPIPGGDAAVRNPYRLGWAYVDHLLPDAAPEESGGASQSERALLRQMVVEGVNTPWTSSAGRLFDAVSALLGIRERVTYEAQAAVALEMLAEDDPEELVYPYGLAEAGHPETWGRSPAYGGTAWEIKLAPLLEALLSEHGAGVPVGLVSHRFHRSLANMAAEVATLVAQETGVRAVALSGGCFQNRLLLRLTRDALEERGLAVFVHRQVPCNDGGISLGQVVVAQGVVGGA